MPVYEIRIDPIDPVLFGDNRSARAGLDHLQRDQDPSPLTVHGAIGRYLQRQNHDAWPGELLGEPQADVLHPGRKIAELRGFCLHEAGGGLFFPRPRHLRCALVGGGALRPRDLVGPRESRGSRSSTPWPRLLVPTEVEALRDEVEGELLVRESALGEILCGTVPTSAELPTVLYRAEPRPGIAVDNHSGTVIEGQFFNRPYRRFQPSTGAAGAAPAGFMAWFETLAPVALTLSDDVGFLGGDRRRARFRVVRCDGPLQELREQVADDAEQTDSRGFLLYLLTPALQTAATAEAAGQKPVAAALGKPIHGSGWNVEAGAPREVHALVPAGSVYFFEWPADAMSRPARADLTRSLWLQPLHTQGAAAGFGRCLSGIWR